MKQFPTFDCLIEMREMDSGLNMFLQAYRVKTKPMIPSISTFAISIINIKKGVYYSPINKSIEKNTTEKVKAVEGTKNSKD